MSAISNPMTGTCRFSARRGSTTTWMAPASCFIEYGFERGVATEYTGDGKRVVVEIFKMADGDAAYGIYTLSNYASAIEKQDKEKLKINDPKETSNKDLKGENYNLIGDVAVEFYKGQLWACRCRQGGRFTLMTFANNILSRIPKQLNVRAPSITSRE